MIMFTITVNSIFFNSSFSVDTLLQYDAAFIVDEVQTGGGGTGAMW